MYFIIIEEFSLVESSISLNESAYICMNEYYNLTKLYMKLGHCVQDH